MEKREHNFKSFANEHNNNNVASEQRSLFVYF